MRYIKLIILLLMLGLAKSGLALDSAKEYEIKAAFLFNLAFFVNWPPTVFADAATPVRICVLGEDPFGQALDVIIDGQHIDQRTLETRRLHQVKDAASCHILFISQSEQARLDDILRALQDKPVLTVSDIADFAPRGGMVQFFPLRKKIRLMLAPKASQQAGLKISSHLLNIATLVEN